MVIAVLIYLAVSVVMVAVISKEADRKGIRKSIGNFFAIMLVSLIWPYPVCLAAKELVKKWGQK
ncbi:hypothetical protein PPK15_gp03 [Bacillus phage 000TH010]|uniref:Uncharacterized protein n=1 Tax=Bacillus phage 000TH010 TaxID=2601652 RepID=A0A5P8PHM9_9CAUD|nr:hypothetical protein PPK15_gp03 [Bacillus phage 000TH010]QFR56216.1 hypothetical protein 000TH010_3 [Bacillus phage 000TH010]